MLILRRHLIAGAAVAYAKRAKSAGITDVTSAGAVNNPYGLRVGPGGDLYVCEIGNHRVSRVRRNGEVESVIADQKEPYELCFLRDGNILFVDMPAHSVKMLDRKSGTVRVLAGTGEPGFGGDGGPATRAQFRQPHSIALAPDRRLLICDIGNHRIRRLDLRTGIVDTYAGTGERKPTPDGSPVPGTPLNGPRAIDFDRRGRLWLVLREGNMVYRLEDGRWRHVAGTGEKGNAGDGGDARRALLNGPKGISCARDGAVYIADTENHTIRRIDPKGIITTVAGTGTRGDGPPGDPLKCGLARPHGVYAAADGTIYIGDSEAHRVRALTTHH